MTRDLERLQRAYDHYYYKQIFAGGAVFAGLVLNLHDLDYTALDCVIRFNLKDKNRIEMNIINARDQELARSPVSDAFLARQASYFNSLSSVVLRKGEWPSGVMYRWPEETVGGIIKASGTKWFDSMPYRPNADDARVNHQLVVLEPV
jgi:hypothetical protein